MEMNIKDAPWTSCVCKAKGSIFVEAYLVKKVSALMSPDGKEHIVPVSVLLCKSCGKVPPFFASQMPGLPDDSIAKEYEEDNLA